MLASPRSADELRRHTALVMETAAERVTDGDAAVRAALRQLLSGTLLPALAPPALAPFVPLLMAHVCAAMTHLAEPIRCAAPPRSGRPARLPLRPACLPPPPRRAGHIPPASLFRIE